MKIDGTRFSSQYNNDVRSLIGELIQDQLRALSETGCFLISYFALSVIQRTIRSVIDALL